MIAQWSRYFNYDRERLCSVADVKNTSYMNFVSFQSCKERVRQAQRYYRWRVIAFVTKIWY